MIVVQNASSVPPARNSKAEKKKNLLFKQGVKLVSSPEEEKAKKRKLKTPHTPHPQIASRCHVNGVPERKRKT